MSNVSQLPPPDERNEKRRLHLREISPSENADSAANAGKPEKPAVSVGATLRAARLKRGEDVNAVAKTLKMRRDQLEAIEDGDFSRLPGAAYTLGFVRSYARYLGLDVPALIESFKDETADHEAGKPVELVFPEAQEERNLPNGSMLIVALMIAMVIYGISYLTMPARKSPTAAKADEPAVAVVQPAPAVGVPPGPATRQPEVDAAAPVPAEPSRPTTFVAGGAPLPNVPQDTVTIAAFDGAAPSVDAAVPAQTVSNNSNGAPRIVLKALQPTYVRIKDPQMDGEKGIMIDRVLNPGESYRAPERAGLVMQTGNAGGLQVEVDGRNVGVLGKSGEVIEQIPFDAAYFREHAVASQ